MILVELVTVVSRSRSSKCAQLSPAEKRLRVSVFFKRSIFRMPFTRTRFWCKWSQWLRDLGPSSVLDYPPGKKDSMFQIFSNKAYFECPNPCLSPEPDFGGIGHSDFEIWVLQVCSTIRARKKSQCFRFFQTKHISNAPTYALHHNLTLVELVTVASRSGSSMQVCSTIRPIKKTPCFRFF